MSEYLQKIKDQKKAADYILSKIRQFYPSAIVAGGAPRNWVYNTPANDIDVYFHSDDEISVVMDKLDQCGINKIDVVFQDYDNLDEKEENNSTINKDIYYVSIFNITFDGEKVQLIQTNCPEYDVLKKFTSNMSMISYSNNRYHMENDFIFGYCTCCLAFYRDSILFNQSYIDKIIGYYPNFVVVEPEELVKIFVKDQVSSKIAKLRKRLMND